MKGFQSQNYQLSDDDILKARIRTVGIANLQFKVNQINVNLVDVGGQKTERKNWENCFKNVSYLLFVVSLSDFDQIMFEDGKTSRSLDAQQLFGNMANNSIFMNKNVFLVLNKLDVFEKKLRDYPEKFREAYPNFSGNINNVDEAVEHVKQNFLDKISPNRPPSAWIEVIPTSMMDQVKVSSLIQFIARKILAEN